MLSISTIFGSQDVPPPTYSHEHTEHEDLATVPIDPNWILEGNPVSRVKRIHASADGFYEVALWECNAGTFRWHFGCDEVVHVIQGEVLIREDDGRESTLRPGDVAFFPRGTTNVWYVTDHVRKIAINRWPKPTVVDRMKTVVRKGRTELKKVIAQVKPS